MNRFRTLASLALLLLLILGAAPAAHADLLHLNLLNPIQNGTPGTNVDFYAQIYSSDSNFVFLNGDTFGADDPLVIDDSALFTNFNQFWQSGDSIIDVLFTVDVPLDINPGTYAGFFTLQGGYNFQDGDPIASANFNIFIPGTYNPVPEPSSLLLFSTGLIATAGGLRKKWHKE